MSANSSLNRFSRLFFTFGVIPLLFIAGVQLFILSEQTNLYFAWTIPLPFTAAFMGAGYWAALAHAFAILRNPSWDRMRASIPAAFNVDTPASTFSAEKPLGGLISTVATNSPVANRWAKRVGLMASTGPTPNISSPGRRGKCGAWRLGSSRAARMWAIC